MLKKTITYTDFDGNQRTEDFYFNMTIAELTKMELHSDGGMTKFLEKITNERDNREIAKLFERFILESYGIKSLDGKYFDKDPEHAKRFSQTEAFSVLFMEFLSDQEAFEKFLMGIVPSDVAAKMGEEKVALIARLESSAT